MLCFQKSEPAMSNMSTLWNKNVVFVHLQEIRQEGFVDFNKHSFMVYNIFFNISIVLSNVWYYQLKYLIHMIVYRIEERISKIIVVN